MAIEAIQQDAPALFQTLGLSQNLALLDRAWETEIGPMARLAKIVAIEKRALIVEVVSSAAMQEINLRRQELIRKLNRHFKDPFVKQITVRMAQHG
jgi:hypothetical protein